LLVRPLEETWRVMALSLLARRETSMDETPPLDAPLSQSLAVLRQCITTLDTAAVRAPTVAPELQDTVSALRGVETALHQHRDALRRAQHFATLGRLAAGLTHEIRNPLGVLFLHIDLLEEEFRAPSAESPHLIPQTFGEIRTALARLDALVQDYLSLVRVGTIEPSRQDLGAAVQEWTQEVHSLAVQQGVIIDLAGLETVGEVAFHASTLRRAVLNVVQNALEAMPQGGTLTLTCIRTATEVQLRVHDSGMGIAAEHVTRIFEPLYTTKPGGTGLGLYIVREIVVAHGGQVMVESVEGLGATFTFRLPLQ
jgi:signal transduction histidine kinase